MRVVLPGSCGAVGCRTTGPGRPGVVARGDGTTQRLSARYGDERPSALALGAVTMAWTVPVLLGLNLPLVLGLAWAQVGDGLAALVLAIGVLGALLCVAFLGVPLGALAAWATRRLRAAVAVCVFAGVGAVTGAGLVMLLSAGGGSTEAGLLAWSAVAAAEGAVGVGLGRLVAGRVLDRRYRVARPALTERVG